MGTKEVNLRGGPHQLMEDKVIEKLARLTHYTKVGGPPLGIINLHFKGGPPLKIISSVRLFFIKMFMQNLKQAKMIWKYLAGCAMTRYILGHRLLETSL